MRFLRIMLVLVFAVLAVFYTMNKMEKNGPAAGQGPVLECGSEKLDISVSASRKAMLRGMTASDEQDGDLTDRIIISGVSKFTGDDTVKVTYVVFDSDDNMATLTRQIHYSDYHSPRFSLTEPLRYSSTQNVQILDRLKVDDVIDGDISHNVRVSYLRETGDPQIYTMTARVTNSKGDTVELELPVVIGGDQGSGLELMLTDHLIYLERGAEFSPGDYVLEFAYQGLQLYSGNIDISGEVDTNAPGTYYVTYSADYDEAQTLSVLTVVVE